MNKYHYIKSQLAKTNKKNDENYVVTRIWNRIDNLDVKFVTQQYVKRDTEKKYALTDMYFPQFKLHIEINEAHHQKQIKQDEIRESDIISDRGHKIEEINVTKDIHEIHEDIDKIVTWIHDKIRSDPTFIPWDIEKEMAPETYIEKGFMELKDNVVFRTQADAGRCFGITSVAPKQAKMEHPYMDDIDIWFPQSKNKVWENTISKDEKIIRSKKKNANIAENQKYIENETNKYRPKRLIFFQDIDKLGAKLYKFKGLFQIDVEECWRENCIVWKRISDYAKTYPPQ